MSIKKIHIYTKFRDSTFSFEDLRCNIMLLGVGYSGITSYHCWLRVSLIGAVDHGPVKADQVRTFLIFLDPDSSI